MFKTIFALFVVGVLSLTAPSAQAQPVGVGIKLGVPATDAFKVIQTSSISSSDHFVWGPYLELHLPGGNSVEIDALRRGYDFNVFKGNSYEFPVVLKHRIGSGLIRPYFEGGAAFSRLSDIRLSTLNHRSNYGIVAGGGVQINLLLLKLSPEVRYTGWALRNFDGTLRTNRNQIQVLMGFGF
ncbi:MAG: hypothetical protein ABI811_16990 [Acidobacteriota bacterium]